VRHCFKTPLSQKKKKKKKIEGEIKTFHDKQKLKEFTITKPVLQEILKGIL
jgi:hypothetical protein